MAFAAVFCGILYVWFVKNTANNILGTAPEKITLGEEWVDDGIFPGGYDMLPGSAENRGKYNGAIKIKEEDQ
jgi:hypothetical protein